jgi:hypothetical protein
MGRCYWTPHLDRDAVKRDDGAVSDGGAASKRIGAIAAITAACFAAAFLLPAIPQPVDYHDFADHRDLLGVSNALDTLSNAAFLLAGLTGLWIALRPQTVFAQASERVPYAVFFSGVLLTALGSGYYHLAPDNERLFWDRLPMTIAFMALVAAQVGDRIDARAGRLLLLPALLVGAASVLYWRATERAGAGNLVPYGILQAYAVAILFLIAWWLPSRYTRGGDVFLVFAAYVAAKLVEALDARIYDAFGHLVSGHTLKHVAAAIGALLVCRMLALRSLQPAGGGVPSRPNTV